MQPQEAVSRAGTKGGPWACEEPAGRLVNMPASSFKCAHSVKKPKKWVLLNVPSGHPISLNEGLFFACKAFSEEQRSSTNPTVSCLFNHFVRRNLLGRKNFSHGSIGVIFPGKSLGWSESCRCFIASVRGDLPTGPMGAGGPALGLKPKAGLGRAFQGEAGRTHKQCPLPEPVRYASHQPAGDSFHPVLEPRLGQQGKVWGLGPAFLRWGSRKDPLAVRHHLTLST